MKLLARIVPIAHLEQPLHGRPGDVFQQRRRHRAAQVQQRGIVSHRQGKDQNQDGPGAVNRKHRPVEKAPVNPSAPPRGDVARLPNPAAQTVEKKQQDPLVRRIGAQKAPSLR
ncbi:hypothetical protein SDC9_127892 [bioreactor metagenome]|uniref:Uncharacterized protein n=1 Tax=bioreactor metagenome TaxID=1076179 RepID=A0A645CVB0_9ZZZZ